MYNSYIRQQSLCQVNDVGATIGVVRILINKSSHALHEPFGTIPGVGRCWKDQLSMGIFRLASRQFSQIIKQFHPLYYTHYDLAVPEKL